MSIEPLENLVRIRKLKQEAPDQAQIDGMIRSARIRIEDLQAKGLSQEGKFLSARLVDELITITRELHRTVEAMGPADG